MNQLEKNKAISDAIKATRLKRKGQTCKVFKFKVNKSSLNNEQKNSLKMFFVETKRIYNYIIGNKLDPYSINYKNLKEITYLDKDKNQINYKIQFIGSSVIDDTITIIKDSIKGLSSNKKNGNKVGSLRFKSECNSIRLRQYGVTHYIKNSSIKIQGIKRPIKVSGLKQLNKYNNIDYTVANILYDGYDYFISLTCFIDNEKEQINSNINNNIIGIDLGCSTTITTTDGEKIKISIEESERLKGLQAKLSKQIKCSNNWYKTRSKIRKEYNRMNNRKNDISNKIVNRLLQNELVIIQDDQINEWHENKLISKTIQNSILGRIKYRLKKADNVIVLDQWFPTTKHCFHCNNDLDINLSQRTYKCNCGFEMDRDIHAANNIIEYYKRYKKLQSVGTTDLKPVRKITYKSYKELLKQEALLFSTAE